MRSEAQLSVPVGGNPWGLKECVDLQRHRFKFTLHASEGNDALCNLAWPDNELMRIINSHIAATDCRLALLA